MSSPTPNTIAAERLDLSRFRKVPVFLIALGAIGSLAGLILDPTSFAFSWLQAFMFCLSFCMGGFFLVLAHHLFDASWSVGIRRINEHLACLAPWYAALFIPIAILAKRIYPWMTKDPAHDHALSVKLPLFTMPMFYAVAAFCFITWWFFTSQLRKQSLLQDKTGDASHTFRMRVLASFGIFFFAISFTLAAVMWMKAIMHEWFSTMYGVWYFAASVWITLATVYMIVLTLKRMGPLDAVVKQKQFYFIGSLLFAFTVFYSYVTFAQYFIIWNANMPEETFWYVLREKGSWAAIGRFIIFFHFFVPFLLLLRIDAKLKPPLMGFLCILTWILHFCDISFNIMPEHRKDGFALTWVDLSCLIFMVGVLATIFLRSLAAHPIYPLRDPRLAEGLDVYVPPVGSKPLAAHGGGH